MCVDFSPERCEVTPIGDLSDFLAHHRPAWCAVRWIHVQGLSQMSTVHAFAEKYQLHPLAIEDLLLGVQRPKADDYPGSGESPGRLFAIARTPEIEETGLRSEQISLFLGRTTLLTFQESRHELFDGVLQRLKVAGSRLRSNDASFLFYSLIDTIVDRCFPVLETYSERLEQLEHDMLASSGRDTLERIHALKRDLVLLRRVAWPMREMISQLQREKHECLSEAARTYFRDVYDHCVQIIDLIETYREIAASLTETYMSIVSNRMNEVMKVLTIISTIFIPMTFLAGVYGMNMKIPEYEYAWAYPLFWTVCAGIAVFMLWRFRRSGWM